MMTLTPPTSSASDAELLALCLDGDRAAFRPLVERYQSLLCSIAYAIVGDLKRSEDVAQEAFIAAWKQLATLGDAGRFRPWLCAIARNLAHHAIRKDRPVAPLEAAAGQAAPGPTPEQEAISREEEAIVWSALQSLDETYREPLVLYYREEHSVAAVAAALEISPDAVKQRLSRGREMLRQNVAERIESALRRSRPGAAFTTAVLAALPAVVGSTMAATAKAATLGSAAKVAAPLAKAAASAGSFSALFGMLGGLAGGGIGAWASYKSARYQRQREYLRRQFVVFAIFMLIFMTPFAAMMPGWHPFPGRPAVFFIAELAWVLIFTITLALWSWRVGRGSRRIIGQEMAAGAAPLPQTALRRWLSRWEGREYRSRLSFLGLPLVHIHFGNPDRMEEISPQRPVARTKLARGWIAIGERAHGGLFAFGNIALAPIALGGVSVGLLSLGGVALGALPIGGLAAGLFPFGGASVGVGAVGGLAIGYWALGGGAIGWRAARGGFAAAVQYADGGQSTAAYAAHANDAAARAFVDHNAFFQVAGRFMSHALPLMGSPWFFVSVLGVSVLLPVAFWLIGYRRKRS